jgi:uncharacterized membrane protein YccC
MSAAALRSSAARWCAALDPRRIQPATLFAAIAPADVWPDAVRMTLAAVLAFAASRALDMHGGFFAVLTALMTTRPGAGGISMLRDRLVGMALGIAVGLSLCGARRWHVPEDVLVAIAMAPLCFLVARFRKYQVAPITAIIVLSAGPGVTFALHGVLMRILDVCLGAAIGFAVAAVVMRRSTDARSRQHAANVLNGCGALVVAATAGGGAVRDAALRGRIRSEMRMVMVTGRLLRAGGKTLGRNHIAGFARLQADVTIYARALADLRRPWRARAAPVLERLADSVQSLCATTAEYLCKDAPSPDFASFDAALLALRALSDARGMPLAGDAAAALPFLLLRLRTDLAELVQGYATLTTDPNDTDDLSVTILPALALASD